MKKIFFALAIIFVSLNCFGQFYSSPSAYYEAHNKTYKFNVESTSIDSSLNCIGKVKIYAYSGRECKVSTLYGKSLRPTETEKAMIRYNIEIGDYKFKRTGYKVDHNRQAIFYLYGSIYYETERLEEDEVYALYSHLEKHKNEYESKFNCVIENINYDGGIVSITLKYNDWEDFYWAGYEKFQEIKRKQELEEKEKKQIEKEKRLESINW